MSSLTIEKLFKDEREVGKTFKGTKKYYVWEFVLNGKFHKVEMFHSKVSSKKKLCLDAQVLIEDKSFSTDFQYSFGIDKNYFNVVQLTMDKFDLRIDNRPFEHLMSDERSGRLKTYKKKEPKPTTSSYNSYNNSNTTYSGNSKRNNNDDFFVASDDEDAFDFTGGKTNKNYGFVPPSGGEIKKKKTAADLLNMNDIQQIKQNQQRQMKPEQDQTFMHNKDILSNIDIFNDNSSNTNKGTDNILTMDLFGNNGGMNQPPQQQSNNTFDMNQFANMNTINPPQMNTNNSMNFSGFNTQPTTNPMTLQSSINQQQLTMNNNPPIMKMPSFDQPTTTNTNPIQNMNMSNVPMQNTYTNQPTPSTPQYPNFGNPTNNAMNIGFDFKMQSTPQQSQPMQMPSTPQQNQNPYMRQQSNPLEQSNPMMNMNTINMNMQNNPSQIQMNQPQHNLMSQSSFTNSNQNIPQMNQQSTIMPNFNNPNTQQQTNLMSQGSFSMMSNETNMTNQPEPITQNPIEQQPPMQTQPQNDFKVNYQYLT